jgi:hypothetical protein
MLVNGHLERWLLGLVHRPNGIVHAGGSAHLDVAAQYVTDRM